MKAINLLLSFLFLLPFSLKGQCFVNESNYVQNHYRTYTSSGDPTVDDTFYRINQYLTNTMGFGVVVGFYDDTQTGPNAFAIPSNDYYTAGQTYFGLNLLNEYLMTGGNNAINYVFWILAHEYAHILQFKNGGQIWRKTKWNELQADFIAGSVATANTIGTSINMGNAGLDYDHERETEVSLRFFQKLGDTNFGNPGHHGTPNERAFAFMSGRIYGLSKDHIYNNGSANSYYLSVEKVWEASKSFIYKIKN